MTDTPAAPTPPDDPWIKAYNQGWQDGRIVGQAEARSTPVEALDVERLRQEFGYLLDIYGRRNDEHGHWANCRDMLGLSPHDTEAPTDVTDPATPTTPEPYQPATHHEEPDVRYGTHSPSGRGMTLRELLLHHATYGGSVPSFVLRDTVAILDDYRREARARSTPAETAQGAAPLDPDERYLRLREVSELLDLPSWDADARTNRLGVDEFQGARWLASWLGVKIAALDWLRSTPVEALDVERLQRAIIRVRRHLHEKGMEPVITAQDADLLVAEYARLSPHNGEADHE